jgi:hypothetical protein
MTIKTHLLYFSYKFEGFGTAAVIFLHGLNTELFRDGIAENIKTA